MKCSRCKGRGLVASWVYEDGLDTSVCPDCIGSGEARRWAALLRIIRNWRKTKGNCPF
jgi:DnaJ-class molecular chaperone